MYVVMGVDAMFCEFPVDSYRWFTELGLYSKLKHTTRTEDFSTVCAAERYIKQCMSLETFFGGQARHDQFNATRYATCAPPPSSWP